MESSLVVLQKNRSITVFLSRSSTVKSMWIHTLCIHAVTEPFKDHGPVICFFFFIKFVEESMNELKICHAKSYIISSVLTIETDIILSYQVLDVYEINLRYYQKEITPLVVISHVL